MIPREFIRQVKDVLAHLYDAAHLQTHPLCGLLVPDLFQEAISKGQALRRVFLEAIEELQPAPHIPYNAKEWRPYRVLFAHYVQRTPVPQVLAELCISDRQYQREHAKAIRAVAGLLWNQCEQPAAAERPGAVEPPADVSEVGRFVAGAKREMLNGDRLIRGAVRAVERLAAGRGITIDLQLDASLPPLYGDRGILRQIVLNILSYLLAMPVPESAANVLRVGGTYQEDAAWLSFVLEADSGTHPIPLDDPSSPRLAVARQLCQAMDGSLDIQGNTVHLRLPLRKMVLLVIDDNQDVIHLFERYLADGHAQVMGATTGEEAMDLARQTQPSLITLDVMMPTHDGWEILQGLKHHPETREIPVAICSILEEPQLALSLGADDYIKKPVTQKALLDLLARWNHAAED